MRVGAAKLSASLKFAVGNVNVEANFTTSVTTLSDFDREFDVNRVNLKFKRFVFARHDGLVEFSAQICNRIDEFDFFHGNAPVGMT